jgi:hypothetical protein
MRARLMPDHIKALQLALRRWKANPTPANADAVERALLEAGEIERRKRRLNETR